MLGLAVLIFLCLYLLVSVWVTRKAVLWAKSSDRKPWLWGWLGAFFMYNLVFWDFIPTLVIHKYYCSNQAGFWVYKTPEKWKLDNPNMRFLEYGESKANDFSMEITEIGGNKISFSTRATSGIQYTEILNPILPVIKNRRLDEILFDKRKNTVLAKKVTFQSGHVSGAPKEFSDYRFWVNYAQCDGKNGNANKNKWLDAFNQFMKFGE